MPEPDEWASVNVYRESLLELAAEGLDLWEREGDAILLAAAARELERFDLEVAALAAKEVA